MEFIGRDNHNNYSTITVIMLDYHFCIPFSLFLLALFSSNFGFSLLCPRQRWLLCAELSLWTAGLQEETQYMGKCSVLGAGWPSSECCEIGMTCVHWQQFSTWLCQDHLDSAPPLSRVIISRVSPLMLATQSLRRAQRRV